MNTQLSTEFLDDLWGRVPGRQRQWHIDQNDFTPPVCRSGCGTLVKWSVKNQTYSRYCSSKCAQKDPQVRQKTETTCLAKYGSKTNLQTETTKNQIRETCLKKYGVDNFSKTLEFKNQFKQTCTDRYGVDNPSKLSWVKDKIDQTHLIKWGRKRSSQTHISTETIDLKNNLDEMKKWYFDLKMPVSAIAEILNVNHSQLCVHFKQNLGIDITRHTVSYPEQQLQEFIGSLEPTMITNDRSLIRPKELDILIPDKKIAIEYHGLAWHSEIQGRKSKTYHLEKLELCQQQGYRLIQIFSNEWLTQQELVKSRLSSILGHGHKLSARKCEVKVIDNSLGNQFFRDNHIQGSCVCSVTLGLFDKDRLVMAVSFGRPRFNRHYQWELLRMASLQGHNVRGGADRLFKYFVREYSPTSIISYSDRRWNTGGVYSKLGFSLEKNLGPNYWYTRNYLSLENRVSYQKARLAKSLDNFNPHQTEWENMSNHGFDRVWDCGNTLWTWIPLVEFG